MTAIDTNTLRENAIDLEPVRADVRLSNTQWARVHIAKRALFAAADEVDRLREALELVVQQRDALAEVAGIEPEWTESDA